MDTTNDRLGGFVATSAALHAILFAAVVFAPYLFPAKQQAGWGTSLDKSAKVGVTNSLPGVPLPSPPVVQPDARANDSKTLNPPEVTPKPQPKAPPKSAELKIPSGKKPDKAAKKEPEPTQVARGDKAPVEPAATPANAIPGAGGAAALPYGSLTATGAGQATFGDGSFGTKFPEYVNSMIRAIEEKWQSPAGIARGTPRVYLKFTIGKRGQVSDVEIDQSSGSVQLDNSAKRAVLSATLPSLPPAYSGSSVDVRFYFEYSR